MKLFRIIECLLHPELVNTIIKTVEINSPQHMSVAKKKQTRKTPKAPAWFSSWQKEFREEMNTRVPAWFAKWEKEKFDVLVKRIDNLIVKNNLIE